MIIVKKYCENVVEKSPIQKGSWINLITFFIDILTTIISISILPINIHIRKISSIALLDPVDVSWILDLRF